MSGGVVVLPGLRSETWGTHIPNPNFGRRAALWVSLAFFLAVPAFAGASSGLPVCSKTAFGPAVYHPCEMPGVEPGGIDDVNAIGRRDIGGRGFGNWYSRQTERGWGNRIAQKVLKSAKIVKDPVVNGYVNRIGHDIVRNSDAKVPFTIKVIDTDEINAFALPGGYFFINSGLILAAGNEAQLAAVMAHEIAHVAAHHQARELTRMHYANLSAIPLIMLTGYGLAGYGIYEASTVAAPIAFFHFQRKYEEQADWLGVEYMYKAGYDPEQMIAFFKKIETLQKTKPGLISKAFSTHPQTPERVKRTRHEIAAILPPKRTYIVDTSEFHAIQARLRRIENRRSVKPEKAGKSGKKSGAEELHRATATEPSASLP